VFEGAGKMIPEGKSAAREVQPEGPVKGKRPGPGSGIAALPLFDAQGIAGGESIGGEGFPVPGHARLRRIDQGCSRKFGYAQVPAGFERPYLLLRPGAVGAEGGEGRY